MRSRNGNRSFLLAVCTVIFAASLAGDDYIISYRSVTQDAVLLNEQLDVSRAMRGCKGEPLDFLLLDADKSQSLKTTLLQHHESFLSYIRTLPLHLTHHEQLTNSQSRSRIVLRLPPRCFTVEFNDDFVKIAALK